MLYDVLYLSGNKCITISGELYIQLCVTSKETNVQTKI